MNSQTDKFLEIFHSIDFHKIIDHPNILIAANFWEEERFCAAKICYKFMRAIDGGSMTEMTLIALAFAKTLFASRPISDLPEDVKKKVLEMVRTNEEKKNQENQNQESMERFKEPSP